MEKMGWQDGKGLGAKQDGITKNLALRKNAGALGVGADINTAENWLETATGFSALLERLNSQAGTPTDTATITHSTAESSAAEEAPTRKSKSSKKAKKRSRDDPADSDVAASAEASEGDGTDKKRSKKSKKEAKEKKSKKDKKEKKDKDDKKSKRKDKKSKTESSEAKEMTAMPAVEVVTTEVSAPAPIRPMRVTHRAKFLRQKRMSTQSTASLNEILGIKASTVTVKSSSATAAKTAVSVSTTKAESVVVSSSDGTTKEIKSLLSTEDYFAKATNPHIAAYLSKRYVASSTEASGMAAEFMPMLGGGSS
ncbi:PIN2/TERF1-interacting telomerase inhibitor 1 [Tieghemiomyces parasiticus]|uniref:PIN2/TERF1-interacting telomerase inhibitor 1 n=1 Tax=Tieghemiomyces parasiticus TaxID=78921 RepID=A0A9W8AAH8_9FUNG|nr:PIN2/TERF1-interacting telomerase inhibitor 1 [Tieghemiomyces parasiticus]